MNSSFNKQCTHWSPHDSHYWHMYCNFSHCLGYLAKASQFWITGIHGIGWHHACKPWANHIQREIIIPDWQASDWLRREEAAHPDLFAVSESWQDQSKAKAFSLSLSLSLSLSFSLSLRKPIESFHSGFAAELNYPPTQSVAESKKPLLPGTQFQQPPCRFPQYHDSTNGSSRIRVWAFFTKAGVVLIGKKKRINSIYWYWWKRRREWRHIWTED